MKKIIYEDKYGHGELKEGHTYKVKDGRVIKIDKDKTTYQYGVKCPKCDTIMDQKKVDQPNPNNVKVLFDCPKCHYYYYE